MANVFSSGRFELIKLLPMNNEVIIADDYEIFRYIFYGQ